MKLLLLPILLLSANCVAQKGQEVDNVSQGLITQLEVLQTQLALTQIFLGEIAQFGAEAFRESARITLGNDAEQSSIQSIPGLGVLVDNLNALQSLMRDLGSEFQKIVSQRKPSQALLYDSSSPSTTSTSSSVSKTNTTTTTSTETQTSGNEAGPQAVHNASQTATSMTRGPAEVLIGTVDTATQQLSQMARIMTDMTGQFTKFIATSSQLLTGFRGTPGLAETAFNTLEEFSRQFQEVQKGLKEVNTHFNRMIEIGSRALGRDGFHHYQELASPQNPGQAALNVLSNLTAQLTSALRILEDINGQFNRIIATSSKILTGDGHTKWKKHLH